MDAFTEVVEHLEGQMIQAVLAVPPLMIGEGHVQTPEELAIAELRKWGHIR